MNSPWHAVEEPVSLLHSYHLSAYCSALHLYTTPPSLPHIESHHPTDLILPRYVAAIENKSLNAAGTPEESQRYCWSSCSNPITLRLG